MSLSDEVPKDELIHWISGSDPKRATEKTGWALLKTDKSNSWLGGLPVAPADFEWPRDEASNPLFFFGQLEISELRESNEIASPSALPQDGALLFFAGFVENIGMVCSCLSFSRVQMDGAAEHSAPSDLGTLRTLGFYLRDGKQTLQKRFVKPTAFRSFGDERDDAVFAEESGKHRFLGLEPPFSNNWRDLRGKDCLISFGADRELGTLNDHHYGLSIWCSRDDLDAGEFFRCICVSHIAV